MLIDCGISLKALCSRMSAAGLDVDSVEAVIVSHGHGDHVRGVPVLSRRKEAIVFANDATVSEGRLGGAVEQSFLRRFKTGGPFSVGDLTIDPFPLPHDATDTAGFVISDGSVRAGFATDLGSVTLEVQRRLSGCDVCVLESNHDEEMLMRGPYPAFLKRRVGGPAGHLSNEDAAGLVSAIAHRSLAHLVLVHLSETNNRPDLPLAAAACALGRQASGTQISLGRQDKPGQVITLR